MSIFFIKFYQYSRHQYLCVGYVLCIEISDLYQLLTKKSFETTLKQLQNEMS